jgi:hypothetical protein
LGSLGLRKGAKMSDKEEREKIKQRYVDAGYAEKDTKWYWDKGEKAWCLPLREIVLSEEATK